MNCAWKIMQNCLHVFNCDRGNAIALGRDTSVAALGKKGIFFLLLLIPLVLPSCKEQPAKEIHKKPVLVYGNIQAGQKKIVKISKKPIEILKQSVNKPGNKPVNKSSNHLVNRSVNKQINQPVNKKARLSIANKEKNDSFSMEKLALPESDKKQEVYTSEGKLDPFAPLIKNDHKKAALNSGLKAKPRRILTPLEKFDFSQIKLVAVITAASGNIAMVEDSTRKGYTIRKGTYIGKNGGKVVKIERDRVIVMEHEKNYKGESVIRYQVLKLNKPDNEG